MQSEAFDFFIGDWTVAHRRLARRLAGCGDWVSFGGTCTTRKILQGQGNMDDNLVDLPGDPYAAVTMRLYDPGTELWSIYWIDARYLTIDPPVRGRFEDGVGTFYGEDEFEGRPIRVRFLWSDITPISARWSQAFSPDGGETWETNWIMDFTRVG
jgi:hypothetical protein